MRDTSPLDPAWQAEPEPAAGSRILANALKLVSAMARSTAPHLLRWAGGMKPQLQIAWGNRSYHLRRDGLVIVRRAGPGYGEQPRSNYNERVARKQEQAAATSVDFTKEVAAKMGIDGDGDEQGPVPKDPALLKAEITRIRSFLQQLDDAVDYDLVEAVDSDLYQLYKAVDYKLKNHKANEAKARLDKLFG